MKKEICPRIYANEDGTMMARKGAKAQRQNFIHLAAWRLCVITSLFLLPAMAWAQNSRIADPLGPTKTKAKSVSVTIAGQYAGVPSTFTIGTTDATVFTLAAGEVGFIQNLDDAALAVKKGASASTTSLSFILAAGTAADDGKGGAVVISDWVGVVSVAAMTGLPRYIAWKQAP